MRKAHFIAAGELMASKIGSVDPSNFPHEVFDLYSVPAFDKGEPDVVNGSAIGSTKQIVQPGDVMLCKIVPHIRRAWVVGESRGRRIIASSEWIVFRGEQCHPEYFRHLLVGDAFHRQFMRTVSGVGGSLLRARPINVAKIRIPLPALAEQQRIGGILDKADTICRKGQAMAELERSLLHSLFLQICGDPRTNSKNWPTVPIASFVSALEGGQNIKALESPNERTRHWILKVSAVTWGDYQPNESKPLLESFVPPPNHLVRPGDLLITRANTRELIGATVYVWDTPPNMVLPDKIWRFVWKDPKQIEPLFVHALFNEPVIRAEMGRLASGTSGSMKNIAKPKILTMRVPLPPLEIQNQVARCAKQANVIRERVASAVKTSDNLYSSLAHRAFHADL